MRNRLVSLAAAAAAVIGVAACGSDNSTAPVSKIVTFTGNLTPSGEPGTLAGNPTGSGTFTITLDTSTNLLTWNVQFSGLTSNVNNGHIHGPFVQGGTQTAASVILNFDPAGAPAGATGVAFTGLKSANAGSAVGSYTLTSTVIGNGVSGDSLKKLLLNGNAYVNIHTTTNPGGEIRAQIVKK